MNTPLVASFNKAAKDYMSYAQIQRTAAQKLSTFIPTDRRGRVLELAAGSGLFTAYLIPWEGEVLATDFSDNMVNEGIKNTPHVSWETMDLRYPVHGPWDYIFSSSALQWVDNPVDVFKAWKSVLAPEGRILGSLFASGTLFEWTHVSKGIAPLEWRSEATWEASINKAGFKLVRVESEKVTTYFPSALDLLKVLRHMGATPHILTDASKLRTWLKAYDLAYKTNLGVSCTWVLYRFEAAQAD